MKNKEIIIFIGFMMFFISCNMPTKVKTLLSEGEITENIIPNTPYPSNYGWSVSKGAKRYYLKNKSRTKIYTFTIKKTNYRNGEFKDNFDTYKLSPGEETEIGISMFFNTDQPSDIDEVVSIKIVGEVESEQHKTMKKINLLLTVLLLLFSIRGLAQKEITYKVTEFVVLDENGDKKALTAKQKNDSKEILNLKFYITEFDNQVFLKDEVDSKNPLRLDKVDSFFNTREYYLDEPYMSWKLKITSYPLSNSIRIEMKAPDKETGKMGTVVFLGKEIQESTITQHRI